MPSGDRLASVSDFDRLLAEAFRTALDLPPETDVTTLVFEEHVHWDSLGHISLVVALEQKFGVSLSEDDVFEIDSYAAAAALLKSRNLFDS
ncbi:MAG: acyl carrier protein [Pseudonocardiaceae bacterium]